MHVQGCSTNGSGSSCTSHKSNLLDDVVREKILVSAGHTSQQLQPIKLLVVAVQQVVLLGVL